MDFARVIDEVFLRLFLLLLRLFQMLITIPILGLAATLVSNFNAASIEIPGRASAALAIACVCVAYITVSFGPVFFEGELFFTTLTVFDALLVGTFIGLTVEWNDDATNTCSAFRNKYAGLWAFHHGKQTDCKIVKALFAFIIVSLVLYIFSTVTCFGLRSLELQHKRRWRDLPLIGRNRKGAAGKSSANECQCSGNCAGKGSPFTSGSGAANRNEELQKI